MHTNLGCPNEDTILGAAGIGGGGARSGDEDDDGENGDNDEDGMVDPLISKEELNLTCYNLMIDVLCSQVQQQDVEK